MIFSSLKKSVAKSCKLCLYALKFMGLDDDDDDDDENNKNIGLYL
jgi:hypothetical protein